MIVKTQIAFKSQLKTTKNSNLQPIAYAGEDATICASKTTFGVLDKDHFYGVQVIKPQLSM